MAGTPSGFNAFESPTAGNSIDGNIHTKTSGNTFGIDMVALNASNTAVLPYFSGDVKVELLDARDNTAALNGSCRTSWVPSSGGGPTTVSFTGGQTARLSLSLSDSDAWRDVRVRMSYPATGTPTVVGCSSDNFAIRPSSFISVSATDGTSSTTGTARSLIDTSATGGAVHKAGRPFTVSATAVNGISGTTSGYDGTPEAVPDNCAGTACAAGWTTAASQYSYFTVTGTQLARYGEAPYWLYGYVSGTIECNLHFLYGDPYPGNPNKRCDVSNFGDIALAGNASNGLVNSVATYSEAGSVGLQLRDLSFTNVDSADGSTYGERVILSPVVKVGRFVPDHFDVTSLAAPVLKTFDSAACATRAFTYIGQPFGYSTAAQATVLARNASGATTANYTGALWKLGNASLAQAYTVTPATPTLDTSAVGTATLTSNNNGTGLLVGNAADKIRFNRPASSPIAPFAANVALTWSVQDTSETGVTGNGSIATLHHPHQIGRG